MSESNQPMNTQDTSVASPRALRIRVCQTFESTEPYRKIWDRLASSNPMLSWEWLSNWWFEIGARQPDVRNRLMIAIVTDADENVCGIAPFYLQSSWRGKTLRMLGDGVACSDYLRILSEEGSSTDVNRSLAHWIASPQFVQQWAALDAIVVEGYCGLEASWQIFWRELREQGWHLDESELESAWALDLSGTLDQVQRSGRDSLRRKCKNLLKLVDQSEVEIECAEEVDHFDRVWPEFVSLHQQRRREIGQAGCFSCDRFERFLRKATRQLLQAQRAKLWFATRQGVRLGSILTLQSNNQVFLYQSGMDSKYQAIDPGHLCNAYLIRWAHENGMQTYNFLRGDERYKKHFGAQPESLLRMRGIAPTWSAQTKHRLYQLAKKTKQNSNLILNWIRQPHLPLAHETDNASN